MYKQRKASTRFHTRAAVLLLTAVGCGGADGDEAAALPPGTELLENGDFGQGLAPWSGNVEDPANATYMVEAGEAVIEVHPIGIDSGGIQLNYTSGLNLHQGERYRLTFRARATPDRTIKASVWENGHDLDHNGFAWSPHQSNEHALIATMRSFTVEWSMPVTNTDAGVCFFMTANPGAPVLIEDGEVVIDDVSLTTRAPGPD